MTEPIHRSYILWDCFVIPSGQPKPWNVSPTEHPPSSSADPTAEMASPTLECVALKPLATTCSCLLSKASPTVASVLDHVAPARLGVGMSGCELRLRHERVPRCGNRHAAASRCAASTSRRARRRLGRPGQALRPG